MSRNDPSTPSRQWTRLRILAAVRSQPGITKTQLCRQLDLAWGTIAHHARKLMREGILQQETHHGRTYMFLADVPLEQRAWLPLAWRERIPQLLGLVELEPGIGIQSLARQTSLSRKVIRRCLRQMEEAGLVRRDGSYRPRFFSNVQAVGAHPVMRVQRDGPSSLPSLGDTNGPDLRGR